MSLWGPPFSFFLPIGIKDADKHELNKIASEPTAEHVIYVDDFHLLHSAAPKLSRRLCFTASEPPRPIKQPVQGLLGFSFYPAPYSQFPVHRCASHTMGMGLPYSHSSQGNSMGWLTLEEQPAQWSICCSGAVVLCILLVSALPRLVSGWILEKIASPKEWRYIGTG